MRRLAALAFLTFAVVALSAQTSQAPKATGTSGMSGDAAALVEIENSWPDAAVKRDVATFDRIYADDLTDVAPDGTMSTKAQDVEDLKSGTFAVESAMQSDLKPRVYGEAAVVTGITDLKGTYKGDDISGQYRFTDTYIKRNGQWKLVATQATKILQKQQK